MDKQDELVRVIGEAYDSYDGVVSAPYEVRRKITIDAIAAAVRSFMGSPAVVSRAEHAAARVAAVGVGSLDVPVVQMTRAALSAAIGEDIGGGRGAQD